MGLKDMWDEAGREVEARKAAKGRPVTGPAPAPAGAEVPLRYEVATYKNAKEYEQDAKRRARDGWRVTSTAEQAQKTAIGRTAAKTVLTGGLGLVVMGRSRKGDTITVTWVKGGT